MKYLVVSDSHGDRNILVDILEKNQGSIDYFFHCGDSELSSDDELFQTYISVGGNCDFDPGYQERRIIQTPNDRIYMTHGHLSSVRFGLTQISFEAQEADADIVLFGHTHMIGCEMVKNRLYLNPGSISQPRGSIQVKSYAIITSEDQQYHVQYYDRNHQPVSGLSFAFDRQAQ